MIHVRALATALVLMQTLTAARAANRISADIGFNIPLDLRNPSYSDMRTNRVGVVDWRELTDEVANDITIASQPLKAR